jgi:hypothetical protein
MVGLVFAKNTVLATALFLAKISYYLRAFHGFLSAYHAFTSFTFSLLAYQRRTMGRTLVDSLLMTYARLVSSHNLCNTIP